MAFDKDNAKELIKDGILNAKERMATVTDSAKDIAKESAEKASKIYCEGKEKLIDTKDKIDKKIYDPISKEEFIENTRCFPNLIHLLECNPHYTKDACKNAVGFNSIIAKTRVVELIKGEFPEGKLDFYPNTSEIIYLRNPYLNNTYISLNEYFDYIKKARVAELVNIANCLGAKHVKVSYKEEAKRFVSAEHSESVEGPSKAKFEIKHEAKMAASTLKEIEVAAESNFPGHSNPIRPQLIYFKSDVNIEQFIEHQFGPNPTKDNTFTIKYHQGKDLSLDAAAGIDAVISKLKIKATASVKSEIESENRLYLSYEINF